MRSVSTGLVVLTCVLPLSGAVIGCGSVATPGWSVSTASDDGGSTPPGDGAPGAIDAGASGDSGAGSPDSGGSGPAGPDAGAPDTGTVDSSSSADTGVDAAPVTSSDGFGDSRTACINKINALRAANTAMALQPYTLQNTDMIDTCVDTQASTDQMKNSAHYAFINNAPSCMWGNAQGFAQNECLGGYGTLPAGIEKCIQDMWDESLKPNCAGCVGCTQFGGACPNCDYSGAMGYECGHYVNLSAPYFTTVACGFAGTAPSSGDDWSVQNFE